MKSIFRLLWAGLSRRGPTVLDVLVCVAVAAAIWGSPALSAGGFRGSWLQLGLGVALFGYGTLRTHLIRRAIRKGGPLHRLQDWDGPQR